MQRFCSLLFFVNCWFLPIQAGESPTHFQDLGQSRIRGELQNLKNEPEIHQSFLKSHGLTDVAEWYWMDRLQEKPTSEFPQDLNAGAFEVRRVFTEEPHRLDKTYHAISKWIENGTERPVQLISFLLRFLEAPVVALFAVLFFFSLVYLIHWTPAIVRDLDRLFKAKGASSFFVSMLLVAILAWVLNSMAAYIFFLCLFCLIYSSEKKPFIILGVFLCLGFNLVPIERALLQTTTEIETLEALVHGRTRIDYAPQALQKLAPEEKALWTVRNGAEAEARELLELSPRDPFVADLLKAQLDYNPSNLNQVKQRLLELKEKYGNKPVLLYNLLQIDTQLQSLVAADEWRALIHDSDLRQFNRRVLNWNRLLLPFPSDLIGRGMDSFGANLRNQGQPGWNWILQLFVPWVLLTLAFFFSLRSSGLCIYTGHATPTSREKATRLAQLYQERAEGMEPQARNRYIQEVRGYERRQRALVSVCSWFLPSAAWVVDGRGIEAILLAFFPYLFFWFSFSSRLQGTFLNGLGIDPPVGNLPDGFSFSLFLVGLALFLIVRQGGKRKMDA